MKRLLIATILLFSPLFAASQLKHFHIDLSSQEGEWICTKNEMRKGRYYQIWTRTDLSEDIEAENIYIISSPTSNGENPNMKRLMRNSLFPVKYMPGTRTSIQKESENEALFEWHTPSGHQAVVRLLVEPDAYHTVSHMRKGREKLSEEEIAQRSAFLDTLKLTFSK